MTRIASRTMQAMTPRPIQAERVPALMESTMYNGAERPKGICASDGKACAP